MTVTRNGKIARLPHTLREQLNRRMADGEQGKKLVPWLNGLPEVRAVMAREFAGRPIREQNLSEWKQGGYREWLLQQEALKGVGKFREEAAELRRNTGEDDGGLIEDMAVWILARLMAALRTQSGEGGGPDFRVLRQVCGDVVALRRGDHQAERLRMERERVAMDWKRLEHDGTRVLLAEHDMVGRFKRHLERAMESLMTKCKSNPKAKAALDALYEAVRGPFDEMGKAHDKQAERPDT